MGSILVLPVPNEGIRARVPLRALQRAPGRLVLMQARTALRPAEGTPWCRARAQCPGTGAPG